MVKVEFMRDALGRQKKRTEKIRKFLFEKGVLSLNIMGSPGCGKTTLIESIIKNFHNQIPIAVIEGDLATTIDSKRLEDTGANIFQINTESICHLSPEMIERAISKMDIYDNSILFIENIGNLVCPASFDLGEDLRIVLLSTPEGDDKPIKYPVLFFGADALIITKTDLLRNVTFDIEKVIKSATYIKHDIEIFTFNKNLKGDAEKIKFWIENKYKIKKLNKR
ncbi:MAG: hydrogenase nickel incorporation protein HypB [bacterium]